MNDLLRVNLFVRVQIMWKSL